MELAWVVVCLLDETIGTGFETVDAGFGTTGILVAFVAGRLTGGVDGPGPGPRAGVEGAGGGAFGIRPGMS